MVFYMIILTLFDFKKYKDYNSPEIQLYNLNIVDIMRSFGVFVFVLCGMVNFHQVYQIIKKPTIKRGILSTYSAIYVVYLIACIFGFTAYFSNGAILKSISLYPDRPAIPGSSDIPNKILKIGKFKKQKLTLSAVFVNDSDLYGGDDAHQRQYCDPNVPKVHK